MATNEVPTLTERCLRVEASGGGSAILDLDFSLSVILQKLSINEGPTLTLSCYDHYADD